MLRLLLERSYLKAYNASFAENFYGLKRMKVAGSESERFGEVTKQATTQPLTSADKALSLFIIALFPYMRAKLADLHKSIVEERSTSTSPSSSTSTSISSSLSSSSSSAERDDGRRVSFGEALRRAFGLLWPSVEAGYEALVLAFQVRFMFGLSKFYSPLQGLQGICYERLDREDYKAQRDAAEELERNGSLLAKGAARFFSFFRIMLISSALVFKLVEWYYSPENRAQREASQPKQTSLAALPPPVPPRPLPSAVALAADPKKCPICAKTRTNPAVASSGVVFCYACIHDHVSVNGACPVTGISCSVEQIRRIYQA